MEKHPCVLLLAVFAATLLMWPALACLYFVVPRLASCAAARVTPLVRWVGQFGRPRYPEFELDPLNNLQAEEAIADVVGSSPHIPDSPGE